MKIELSKQSAKDLAEAILKITEMKDFFNVELNKTLISADYKKEFNAKVIFNQFKGAENEFRFPCGRVEISIEETENWEKEEDGK